jgi:hypothetical protein
MNVPVYSAQLHRWLDSERHSQARAGGNFYRMIDYGLHDFGHTIDPAAIVRDVRSIRLDLIEQRRNS